MMVLDTAVLVGIMLVLTKVGDMLLRPHQQARLQKLVEAATLRLSYMSVMAGARRMAHHRVWRLVGILVLLVPAQLYFVRPVLAEMFAADPRATPEIVGLVVVILFVAECVASVPAAFALRWVLRDDSGRKTGVRYGSLVMLLIAANAIAVWMVANDPIPDSGILRRISGAIMLAAGAVTADLFIAVWVFAFALAGHVLLRSIEALAWRVVEYQRGAWAAVVAIATAVLTVVDLYLKRS